MRESLTILIIIVSFIVLCAITYRVLIAHCTQAVLRRVARQKAKADADAEAPAAGGVAAEGGEAGDALEVRLEPVPPPPPPPSAPPAA